MRAKPDTAYTVTRPRTGSDVPTARERASMQAIADEWARSRQAPPPPISIPHARVRYPRPVVAPPTVQIEAHQLERLKLESHPDDPVLEYSATELAAGTLPPRTRAQKVSDAARRTDEAIKSFGHRMFIAGVKHGCGMTLEQADSAAGRSMLDEAYRVELRGGGS